MSSAHDAAVLTIARIPALIGASSVDQTSITDFKSIGKSARDSVAPDSAPCDDDGPFSPGFSAIVRFLSSPLLVPAQPYSGGVTAILIEVSEEWETGKRYITF